MRKLVEVWSCVATMVLVGSIGLASAAEDDLALPDAEAGECFAKVLVPNEFKTITEEVVVREAAQRVEITPPKYETVEEKVVVQEPTVRVVAVPATFESVKEDVIVRDGRLVWRLGSQPGAKIAEPLAVARAVASGIAKDAKVGECYAEYFQDAVYENIEEKIMVREASTKIDVTEAKFEITTEQVLTREASEKFIEVPAVYDTVTEEVLERAAYTMWKKGTGPIQSIDHSTGDIMCKVAVPAKYKTIERKVLKEAATIKKAPVEAEYIAIKKNRLSAEPTETRTDVPAKFEVYTRRTLKSEPSLSWRLKGSDGLGKATGRMLCRSELAPHKKTFTKMVIDAPATIKNVAVPAKYAVVKRRKLVAPASEKRIEIPAEKRTVTRREQVSASNLAWRAVLCETNATPEFVRSIQRSLQNAGYDPGPVDGKLGRGTLEAAEAFQRAKNLSIGGLTAETIKALGLKMPKA